VLNAVSSVALRDITRTTMTLLDFNDLRARGIPYSRVHIWRLERAGEFPKRVPIGRARHGWLESEIEAWIRTKVAARETTESATAA